MHKHGPALFFLTEGRKKWYLSHPKHIDDRISNCDVAAAQQKQKQNPNQSDNNNNNKILVGDERTSTTHPGFYQHLSTHKCIQRPGELLFVPNLWYHEIYNLSSPTIGIQALAEELAAD